MYTVQVRVIGAVGVALGLVILWLRPRLLRLIARGSSQGRPPLIGASVRLVILGVAFTGLGLAFLIIG
jgi:hypothetical protein